jgi:hypothetical protein
MGLLAGVPARVAAQQTVNYASVSGRVTDASGASVPGATIIVRHVATNVAATVVSDGQGRFRLPYLEIGACEVVVSAPGFATVRRTITLTVGGAFDLPVALEVAGVEASVTVAATAPVLETARTQVASTVGHREAADLPINGRNLLDLALLVPGVSPPNIGGGTQLFAETSAVPGAGLSIGSQRNLSNSFLVDGLSANDDAAALSGGAYGLDAVDALQVVTSGGQAELGRALGGYVSVVTRSGTNVLHGDVFGNYGNDRWNAPNPLLAGVTLPFAQTHAGISLGGPIVRNRTFFFGSVEQRRLNQSGLATIDPEDVAAINARLDTAGYGGARVASGVFDNVVRTTTGFGKVDHQLRGGSHVGVRYSLYDARASHARGAGGLNAPSASSSLDNLDQTVAVSHIAVLSPRTVSETRGQASFSDLAAPPVDPFGPAVTIAGVATFGTSSNSPTRRRNSLYEIVSNVSHQAGPHAMRAGVDVIRNALTITFPRAARGSYSFSSLADFLDGTYTSTGFTQTFGARLVRQTNPNLGIYVQDEWRAARGLTVNAGVRYDLQWLETIATDTNNIAPRLGMAWQPGGEGRTVVRASAGVFYDRIPLRALANALLSAGNSTDLDALRQVAVTLAPRQTGAPVFPGVLADVVPSVTRVNLTTMDPGIQNAHSTQVSVEIERQVGARAAVSVAYEHLRGDQLILAINRNVPTCAVAGGNNGCRPIAEYANNTQYSSEGRSRYDALHVSFVQRPSTWGGYRVSYALSKALNDVGEAFFSQPIDPADLSKDWARSDGDQRHRLVVDGTIRAPATKRGWWRILRGFQVSGVVQVYSALPFNITSGVTTIQGTLGRPIVNGAFIQRNAGTGDDFLSVNLRIARTLHVRGLAIDLAAEAFNLTNRVNVTAVNGNFGPGRYPDAPAAGFGTPVAVDDSRSWQFGLRATF